MMDGRSKGSPLRRLVIRVCAGAILCLLSASALFTFFVYPFHGLKGFGREQYEAAIMKAAKDFAPSESLAVSSIVKSRFEAMGENEDAYAWGSVSLRAPCGDQVYLWVSLKWYGSWHRWRRDSIFIMADPRNRLFYAESVLALGSFKKTIYAIQNAKCETLRNIREIWLDLNPG
ncbi:MAG: hypothetical protein ABSF90_09375 [Syntrophobacteraceae bacterium]|jgi:hypothetical protein